MVKKYIVTIEEVAEHPKKTITEVGRELDAILDGYTPPAANPVKSKADFDAVGEVLNDILNNAPIPPHRMGHLVARKLDQILYEAIGDTGKDR